MKAEGLLTIVSRLPQSTNGNARFLIMIGDDVCRTAPDSCLADHVKNLDGRQVTASIRDYYGQPTLEDINAKID